MHTCQPREKVSRDKMAARRANRDGLQKGGPGGESSPGNFQKPVLQMVQSEVFLSYRPYFACAGANVNEINAKILLRK